MYFRRKKINKKGGIFKRKKGQRGGTLKGKRDREGEIYLMQ